ncbi:MAG: N-6 DNA methylase [Desulfamplus sp.]
MLDTETKKRIDTARDILVGKVPDPKSQVEQITIALIYKFMDDMDKESVEMGGQASFFSGEYERYAWSKIFDPRIGGYEMLAIYSEALVKLNQNPNIPKFFRDIFKNAYLPYRDPETLKMFLKIINEFNYDHSERLGDAFEYLLSVMSSQRDAGQFRTPRHIIDFIVEVVNPQKHESILDPACGTAGFLISSYKHIIKQNTKNGNTNKIAGDLLSTDERKKLLTNFKGYDISPDMVRLSLVNLYLHGFVQPQIAEYDTLTSEDRWNEYADVILANPPFMSPKGGISLHKKFSVQSKRSEVLFVDYIAEHLTHTGRAGVIVPEGIIFQSGKAYKQLRKMLVENYLYAVVSLPAGIFNPYSGVKTSILLMDKTVAKRCDSILFVKIGNDGFGLGAQLKEQTGSDLPDAVNVISDYVKAVRSDSLDTFKPEEKPCGTLVVKKERLAENGEYNLTGERYRVVERKGKQKWEMVRLGEVCYRVSESINPNAKDGEVRYIGLENIESNTGNLIGSISSKYEDIKSTKNIFEKNDILYGKLRPNLNKVHLANFAGICSTDIYVLRTKNNSLPEYLNSFLRSVKFNEQVLQGLGGAQLPRVNFDFMENLQIPLPPLEVQQEIVSEIEGYQKLIDGARQVVDSWKPQIEINPEWEMVRLGEVCEIKSGGTPNTSEKSFYDGGNIPWLKSEVCKDKIIEKPNSFITEEGLNSSSAKMLKKYSTLIALVGATIGKTGFITFEASTNQNVAALYPIDTQQLNELYLFYSTQCLYSHFMRLGDGKFKMANLSFVKSLEIPLPPLEIQQEIVAKIEAERKAVDGCRELIKIYEEKIKRVIDRVWEE